MKRCAMGLLALAGCGLLFSSCGEKEETPEAREITQESVVQEGELSTASTITIASAVNSKLIEHTFDGSEPDRDLVLEITADVYEAPALALGESYRSVQMLKEKLARPIAKLKNLANSGGSVELNVKEDKCSFKTDVIIGENGQIVDVEVKLGLKEFEMSFSTVLKFTYPAFYEVNVAGQSDKVYVLVLNAFKHTKK